MKKKLIKLSMFVLLSLTTSTLFAQTSIIAKPLAVTDIEKKLTDNAKQWVWYKDNSAMDATASKSVNYSFKTTHKLTINTGGKITTADWKVTMATAGTEASAVGVAKFNIKIGTQNYAISFGSDKDHAEFIMLTGIKPTPVTTNYFYSLLPR